MVKKLNRKNSRICVCKVFFDRNSASIEMKSVESVVLLCGLHKIYISVRIKFLVALQKFSLNEMKSAESVAAICGLHNRANNNNSNSNRSKVK